MTLNFSLNEINVDSSFTVEFNNQRVELDSENNSHIFEINKASVF